MKQGQDLALDHFYWLCFKRVQLAVSFQLQHLQARRCFENVLKFNLKVSEQIRNPQDTNGSHFNNSHTQKIHIKSCRFGSPGDQPWLTHTASETAFLHKDLNTPTRPS